MGFKEGQLFLDSPNGTYYSGQSIKGKLIFQQEKVQSFRGLYVKITGFCHVHWTTSHTRTVNGRSETYTVHHDSHEEYINIKLYMLGGEAGEYTIQPGKYEYPFHFRLPENCPSSFEGPYGHIRYEIKAVIDRAYKFNQEKKVMARVMAHMDLNLDPYCREPIEMELDKLYKCCCVSTGLMAVSVKLPVAGYCPGQTIPIHLSCFTKGRAEISNIKLSITKRVIQALGASWHAHHFVCGGCRKDMGGGSFIERAGRPYCSSCYAHKFASRCAGCGTPITALDAKWHRECFTCTKCRKPVTDSTFSVLDNKPPCGKCA